MQAENVKRKGRGNVAMLFFFQILSLSLSHPCACAVCEAAYGCVYMYSCRPMEDCWCMGACVRVSLDV